MVRDLSSCFFFFLFFFALQIEMILRRITIVEFEFSLIEKTNGKQTHFLLIWETCKLAVGTLAMFV